MVGRKQRENLLVIQVIPMFIGVCDRERRSHPHVEADEYIDLREDQLDRPPCPC